MKIAAIFSIIGVIAIIIIANLGLGPVFWGFLNKIPYSDKIFHFILAGILSFFLNLALKCKKTRIFYIKLLLGSVILTILFILEEFSQMLFKYRTFSIIDLICSLAGIYFFAICARLIYSLKTKNNLRRAK